MEEEAKLLDPNEELALEDMGTGRVELLLRCTSGLYKGRFLYINTSVRSRQADGESFGSDMSSDVCAVTTYIEEAGLSGRHAEIKLDMDFGTYILKDCGSTTGTWVKLFKAETSAITLQPNSALKIGNSLLEFTEGPNFNAVLEVGEIYRLNRNPNQDNESQSPIDTPSIKPTNFSEQIRLLNAQQMLAKSKFPKNYLCVSMSDAKVLAGIKPLRIGDSADCDIHVPEGELYCARISYTRGQFVISQEVNSQTAFFRKLDQDELYNLQPGHVFRIGDLEFEVCRLNVGRWSEQGARPTLEDTDVSIQNLFVLDDLPISYFAVYDGHGGKTCSEYLKAQLHNFIYTHLLKLLQKNASVNRVIWEAIKEAFKACDLGFYNRHPNEADSQGATAVVCLVIGDRIITANLGDSKAVLCRNGRAIELTVDHKPNLPEEAERIRQCGGFVAFGRVCGRLAISRSFGDFCFKEVGDKWLKEGSLMMENSPDIKEIYMNPLEDEFLLIGCDGLFEAYTPQEAVDLIRSKLARMQPTEQDPNRVIREVVNEAVYSRRTRDNVSAILVTLTSGIAVGK